MTQPSKTMKLTKDEVDRLIQSYQSNQDEQAQLTLVECYTNLVDMLAKKYSKGKSFHEDLRQVGMIGLLGAIKRYDPLVGKSFEAFAIPTIIGEIKRFYVIKHGVSMYQDELKSLDQESRWQLIT